VRAPWTLEQAVALCRRVEEVCPPFGCHVALTGGVLYKDGPRKDLDLLFYRVRQVKAIDRAGLFAALQQVGLIQLKGWDWCYKATFHRKPVDLFFPEQAWVRVPGSRLHMRVLGRVRQFLTGTSA
jgi:hypothetical protein